MAKKPTYEALEQRVKELEKVEAERKQAEDTLRENEEKYRTLVEGLEDVIVSFSLDGTILYCSPNVNNFGGYDSKEEIGNHFSKYIADEEVKKGLQEFFQGIIKRKKTITFEFRYLPKSKDPFYVEAKANPIINEKTDEIVSIQCIVRDITERKQAEEELRKYRDHLEELVEERTAELREIEERFSAFMDYLPAIVFIKDENYRMEYMNKHMRDVLGTDDSWMGRTILEILGDTDLARKMIANDKIALSAGFKLKEESVSGAAGTERLYETRKFRIDRKGKSPLLGGIALDITERKQAEEKEKEHHKNIQLLSNTAMKFVEFPADKNIYNFIGEQLRELIGKDSYIVINAIDEEKSILTTRTVLGLGKLSDKVAGLLGKHPVGMTFNAKDEELVYHLSDGKLHLNEEGLYGMLLKTVPKTVCNSIEKLLNIKKIYGIGFTKDNELFGTVAIFLKENAGELKNNQIIEVFIKQASIAVQKRQAEEALRENEEFSSSLLDNSLNPILVINPDTSARYVNHAFEELTGFSSAEVIGGKAPYPWWTEETLKKTSRYLKEAMRKGARQLEKLFQKKNGERFSVEITSTPVKSKGEFLYYLANWVDITERKRAEEALRDSRHMLQTVLDSTPAGIFWKDRDLIYLGGNRTWLEAIGLKSSEEVVGKSDYDLPWEKKQADSFREDDRRVMDLGIPEYDIIEPYLQADGTHAWAKTNKVPLRDMKGNVVGVLGIYEDITERKRAEKEVQESETQKKAILDASIDRIRLTDKDGRIIWANQTHARDLNMTPEELVGTICYEVFVGRDSLCPKCPAQKALKTGKVEHTVLARSQTGKINEIKYLDSYAVPIKNKSGEIVNILHITRDITGMKRAEEELKNSREQLRNLAAYLQSAREQERTSIAREIHDELAQTLTALKMDISWLSKKLPEDQKTLLEKTRTMTKLTDTTIKTVKRISTELRPGLLDDLGLVAAIEWQAEEFKNRTGITCELTIDPEDIMVEEKRSTTLFRIFQETLTNIARHARATAVTVSLREKDSSLELRVRDNGKGITKEQISDPKSFGLMGIRERAKSWGGEVKISGRPGKGTVVVVRMPVK